MTIEFLKADNTEIVVETIADYLFVIALIGILIIIFLITFNFIK